MTAHHIRRAEPADAATVARIHVASWGVAYRGIMPDDMIARMDLPTRIARWSRAIADTAWPVFLLEEGGEAVAFCHATTPEDSDLDPARVGFIAALHVLPQLRGGGRGEILFREATAEFGRRGLSEFTLWVLEGNAPARRFYERLGMQTDGGRRTYPGTDVPEVRYRLALQGTTSAIFRNGTPFSGR